MHDAISSVFAQIDWGGIVLAIFRLTMVMNEALSQAQAAAWHELLVHAPAWVRVVMWAAVGLGAIQQVRRLLQRLTRFARW